MAVRARAASASVTRETEVLPTTDGATLAGACPVFDISLLKVLEIVARVSIIYVACMALLRLSGRREMAELGPMDLLAMLLLSETVGPALTGSDESVSAGLLAAATLMALCVLTARITFAHRRVEKLIEGEAIVVIEQGKVNADVLRRFRISASDLETTLHRQGLLHVAEVARAYVEADGKITIIKQKDFEDAQKLIAQRGQAA